MLQEIPPAERERESSLETGVNYPGLLLHAQLVVVCCLALFVVSIA